MGACAFTPCGKEVPPSGNPGKPRIYCSKGCNAAAYYERRGRLVKKGLKPDSAPQSSGGPVATGSCVVAGCAVKAHDKPACPDHLDRMPYAADVIARWEALGCEDAEAEDEDALAGIGAA